jgi:hypothetical protein
MALREHPDWDARKRCVHLSRSPTALAPSSKTSGVPWRPATAEPAAPVSATPRSGTSETSPPAADSPAGPSPAAARSQTSRRSFRCADECAIRQARFRLAAAPPARPAHVDKRCRSSHPDQIERPASSTIFFYVRAPKARIRRQTESTEKLPQADRRVSW